jgi:hypothetical protein
MNEATTPDIFDRVQFRNKFTGNYLHRSGTSLDAALAVADGSCELHIHTAAISSPGTQYWLGASDPRDGGALSFGHRQQNHDFDIYTREGGGIGGSPPLVAIRCRRTGKWWCVDPHPPEGRSAIRATADIDDNDLARFWMESL